MGPALHRLLVLSACLCPVSSVSAQTPIALTNHTETANSTASPTTPGASSTATPLSAMSQLTPREETMATPTALPTAPPTAPPTAGVPDPSAPPPLSHPTPQPDPSAPPPLAN
ncbi:hypothetical protein AAFF_G00303630 [Aldrovandia affinis]|uniref:Uncharacterized protein n=1 Tax=Aldrovandia affinis TaxID=143900 RepID=A0AAD7W0Y3_9TELE|nr:hypothetical protein AAFF_G00303630 [Aldrovandia affinis]